MQLKDLVKPIEESTDEELLERLRTIRHNRNYVKPAAKTHAKKRAKKGLQTKLNGLEAMLAALSDEDRAALLESLGDLDE